MSGCTRREANAKPKPGAIRWCACGSFLKSEGLATDEDFSDVKASVEREVKQAADEALHAPKPEATSAQTFVFSPDVDPDVIRVCDRAVVAG